LTTRRTPGKIRCSDRRSLDLCGADTEMKCTLALQANNDYEMTCQPTLAPDMALLWLTMAFQAIVLIAILFKR